jgi:hypothetical protein
VTIYFVSANNPLVLGKIKPDFSKEYPRKIQVGSKYGISQFFKAQINSTLLHRVSVSPILVH